MLSAIGAPFIPHWAELKPFVADLWLIVTIVAVLITPFFTPRKSNIACALVALAGLTGALLCLLVIGAGPNVTGVFFRGLLVIDGFAIFWKVLLIVFVMGIILMTYDKLPWFYIENIFYRQYLTFTVNGVGAMLLIVSLSAIGTGHGVVYRGVTFISKISYSMYLVHLSLIQMTLLPLISGWFGLAGGGVAALGNYAMFWVLTIGLSYVLYRYFEQPIMNLRDLFSAPRSHSRKIELQ